MPDLHHCPKCGGAGMPRWALNRKEVEAYVCVACGILFAAAKPHTATESVPEPKAGVRGPRSYKSPQKAANPQMAFSFRQPPKKKDAAAPAPPQKGSHLEALLESQLQSKQIVGLVREYRFARPRMYRADFAVPAIKLLIECEGGIYGKSRHTSPLGYMKDCQKYRAASIAGYTLLRYTSKEITSGFAANEIANVVAMLSKREDTKC